MSFKHFTDDGQKWNRMIVPDRGYFQLPGTVPLEIDRLQRSVTSSAIAKAVLLSIKAEMPSGPVALVVSKLDSSLMMSSSVHSM